MAIWSNRILILFGALGIFISGFLSYTSWKNLMIPCGGTMNCQIVLNSPFSVLLGVNVSYIGLAGYVGLFALAILRSTQTGATFKKLSMIGFAMSAVALIYSIFLTYASLVFIQFTCRWCLASLATVLVTTILHAALLQAEVPKANDRFIGFAGSAATLMIALGAVGVFGKGLEEEIEFSVAIVDTSEYALEDALPVPAKVIGNDDAKVTVIEFADINCHACRGSYPMVKDILKKHGKGLRLGYRHFLLMDNPGHETSLRAAMITELAAENGEFWKLMDHIMDEKQTARIKTVDGLLAVAGELGYSRGELVTVLSPDSTNEEHQERSKELYTKVADDMNMGRDMLVGLTPTFIIYAEGEKPKVVTINKLAVTLMSSPYRELIDSVK